MDNSIKMDLFTVPLPIPVMLRESSNEVCVLPTLLSVLVIPRSLWGLEEPAGHEAEMELLPAQLQPWLCQCHQSKTRRKNRSKPGGKPGVNQEEKQE